jgi:uncharacterized protein (DUF885 family)
MHALRGRSALALCLLVLGARAANATPFEDRCDAIVAARGTTPDAERLHDLFDASWQHALDEHPELATRLGVRGHDDRWTDHSLAAIARRERELEAPARVLASIDRASLGDADRLSVDLFARDNAEALEGRRFPDRDLPLSQLDGVQVGAARTLAVMPAATVEDYEAILARLRALPTLVEQTIALMDEGRARGVVQPRVVVDGVPAQILAQLPDDPLASPLLRPFGTIPASIPTRTQERLRHDAAAVYRERVAPAFRRLHDYLVDTYLPSARDTIALGALPDGEAWYAFEVRDSTTTNLTPRAIHEIGLKEVARIRHAMDEVIRSAGFEGGFEAFEQFLRTEPRFYYDSVEALLAGYRDIAKRADPMLVRLFGRLPRLPYGVLPVPAHVERSQPAAYYEPGSLAAGRAGYFFANTSDLASRPRWMMEALVMHEAVPGHHLQIALAQELEGVPEFRRNGSYTAFVEGWGLYAEGLGAELGFYQDPYSRFGRLSMEMWRAVRLVVDTGIHALGWNREKALAYFAANTGQSPHQVEVEVDRYIAWPGQALAYKVGELRLRALRAYAEKTLGKDFDVRAFHDEVLGEGALPLDVLEARVRAWVGSSHP